MIIIKEWIIGSEGRNLKFKWIKMPRKNHERFKKDFGGNAFFVYSVKGSGKKKKYIILK